MIVRKILTLLLFAFSYALCAQIQPDANRPKPVALYVELGGNGLVYSVNLDYSFVLEGNNLMAIRAGFNVLNNYKDNGLRSSAFPLELTGLIHLADNESYIELGPGITYMNMTDESRHEKENVRYFTFRLGYRYQARTGGLVFRAGLLRMNDFYTSNPDSHVKYNTWATTLGLSLGVAF